MHFCIFVWEFEVGLIADGKKIRLSVMPFDFEEKVLTPGRKLDAGSTTHYLLKPRPGPKFTALHNMLSLSV